MKNCLLFLDQYFNQTSYKLQSITIFNDVKLFNNKIFLTSIMKENYFHCSTPRSTYEPIRFQDSLRKYQRPPTKRIKCCSIVSRCKHCCQKNHNISQQERLVRMNSARKLYSNHRIIEKRKQNIHHVSQFNESMLHLRKQLFKDELQTEAVKYAPENYQGPVHFLLAHLSTCLQNTLHEIMQEQKSNKLSTPKYQEEKTQENLEIEQNVIQKDNEQIFNLVAISDFNRYNKGDKQILNNRINKNQNSNTKVQAIEPQPSISVVQHQIRDRSQKMQQQNQSNRKQQENKDIGDNFLNLQLGSQLKKLNEKTLKRNQDIPLKTKLIMQNQRPQQYEFFHPIIQQKALKICQFTPMKQISQKKLIRFFEPTPQKSKRKLAKQLELQSSQIKNDGHFRINLGKVQCIISIRVFSKANKHLTDVNDMVESLIRQRPYLNVAKQELQYAIKNHLQCL